MSIFTPRINDAYRHKIHSDMIEYRGENYTVNQLYEYLFDDDYHGDYMVVPRFYQYEKRTVIQRLNCFWVYPCWLSVCWIKWILTGDTGIRCESKAGEVLQKLIGKY